MDVSARVGTVYYLYSGTGSNDSMRRVVSACWAAGLGFAACSNSDRVVSPSSLAPATIFAGTYYLAVGSLRPVTRLVEVEAGPASAVVLAGTGLEPEVLAEIATSIKNISDGDLIVGGLIHPGGAMSLDGICVHVANSTNSAYVLRNGVVEIESTAEFDRLILAPGEARQVLLSVWGKTGGCPPSASDQLELPLKLWSRKVQLDETERLPPDESLQLTIAAMEG